MADYDRLISIDTSQPQGAQFPAEVQAEINALTQSAGEALTYPAVHYVQYGYETATVAPPSATSMLRLNNANPIQATKMWVNRYGGNGVPYDFLWVLSKISVDVDVVLSRGYSPTDAVYYKVTAPVVELPSVGPGAQYVEVAVYAVSAAPVVFANNDLCVLSLRWP